MFLGTCSAVPRPGSRNVSSMLLQFSSGSLAVIDCGEATQHQLMLSSVKMGQIDNILLTHLHGDHCYGLFGLVHTLNMGGRVKPVTLYGPKGTEELVRTVLRLTGGWDGFDINITELEPETIHSFDLKCSANKLLATVTACPMVHRIPAFGYVFKELDQPMVLDGSKARQLGVPSLDMGKLKSGFDVTLADGTLVPSANVTYPGRPSRTIGIMQDTADASSAAPYMQNCDLLIHEATYEEARREQALLYGHSTTGMAAEMARLVHAKNLVLTHFSSRYSDVGMNDILKVETEAALQGTGIKVVLGEDFMSISGDDFRQIGTIAR